MKKTIRIRITVKATGDELITTEIPIYENIEMSVCNIAENMGLKRRDVAFCCWYYS